APAGATTGRGQPGPRAKPPASGPRRARRPAPREGRRAAGPFPPGSAGPRAGPPTTPRRRRPGPPATRRPTALLSAAGLQVDLADDDEALWAAQREGQRSREGTVLRLSALPSELAAVLGEARRLGASLVGRAGLGLSWLRLE